MTKVRFQADADLKQAIVTGTIRREPNIDFQSAYAAGLEGKQDLRKFPFEPPSVGAYSYTPLPYVVSVRKS